MSTPSYPWEKVPRKSAALFFLGVFCLFSIIGFINDILELGRQPTLRFVLNVLLSGGFAILYALAGFRLRRRSWMAIVPIFVVHFVTQGLIANWLPNLARLTQMGPAEIAQLQHRLSVSGVFTVLAIALAYVCFLMFSITEGRRYFRVHAEMELAAGIHRVLVPPIAATMAGFEFYGRSQPSGEVGGDLIDVVEGEHGWVAYIADVSGHGVAPGVVMGMVKSAARMQLASGGGSANLLPRLNSVLYPLKPTEMFVTLAYLASRNTSLEYSMAGHPPILHYHAQRREISELQCSNLPVGILEHPPSFETVPLDCSPGDLFVLITDGLLEVENKAGEEFGMVGVKAVLKQRAGQPLEQIWEGITAAALQHGKPADDQSLLLVRRLPQPS